MRHRIVRQDEDFALLREDWTALVETLPQPLLPLRWEWFDAWWHSFGPDCAPGDEATPWIHVFEDASGIRGIVPMFVTTTRFRHVRVRAMCSMANGHSPLWDAILHPGLAEAEVARIGAAIHGTPGIDVFLYRRFAEGGRLLQWIQDGAGGRGRYGIRDSVRTPVIDTTGDWEPYLQSQGTKYRKNTRKKVREFEATPGARVDYVRLASEADPVFDEIVEISARSWKTGVRNDLRTNNAGRAFLRRLLNHLGPAGAAGAWLARINGRAIAYELHFHGGGVTYPIRADMDEAWRELSPGSVVEFHALKAAFEDPETSAYDTCAADYWYLRNLTDRARQIHEVEYFPRGLKPLALHLLEYRLIPLLRPVRDRARRRFR